MADEQLTHQRSTAASPDEDDRDNELPRRVASLCTRAVEMAGHVDHRGKDAYIIYPAQLVGPAADIEFM
jgi:hypothetical protein